MIPRYALLRHHGQPVVAWVADDRRRRWRLVLPDGQEVAEAAAGLLFHWEGDPLDTGDPAAALEQLRRLGPWLEAGPPGWQPEALHDALPEGEPVAFESLAGRVLGAEATGWQRARLFWALLHAPRWFRYSRKGFVPRLDVEIRQYDERLAEERARAEWAEKARAWAEALEQGRPPAGPAGEVERFVGQLESLLALERKAPEWKLLGSALDLHHHHWPENRARIKAWLETAGAWRGWGRVWRLWAGIAEGFAPAVMERARELAGSPVERAARVDYRGVPTYSFDSPGTEDIDDAVSILGGDGHDLEIAVHITEPLPALAPGDPVFEEAAQRSSSVYTVEGTFPMLPPPLSNDRLSLRARAEREALSFRFRLGPPGGELLAIERSVVRLEDNLDYGAAEARLIKADTRWWRLRELCGELATHREASGAHMGERPEVVLDISDPERIRLRRIDRHGPVHRIIEELAVLVNREAGLYCDRHGLPAIYRVQPQPRDPLLGTGPGRHAGGVQAARFSLEPDVHTGLACERYVQVTSPIRRFPDLIMQRQISTHLARGRAAFDRPEPVAGWLQRAEQRFSLYQEVERRIEDHWKRRYLAQHPSLILHGIVRRDGRAAHAQVWLDEVMLAVEGYVASDARVGQPGRFRVVEVDPDRQHALVEMV